MILSTSEIIHHIRSPIQALSQVDMEARVVWYVRLVAKMRAKPGWLWRGWFSDELAMFLLFFNIGPNQQQSDGHHEAIRR